MNHLAVLKEAVEIEWNATRTKAPPELQEHALSVRTIFGAEGAALKVEVLWHRAGGCQATYSVSAMPSCPVVAITHEAIIDKSLRNEGIGRWLAAFRLRAYRRAGFTAELCTVRTDNHASNALVRKRGKLVTEVASEHGGSLNLWLTPIPLAVKVQPK